MRHERLLTQPLYRQARDRLVARISAGEWKPGTLLPNEIDLAREFSVSLGTMRKALEMLEAEYLVTRRQGRGTFVNDLASQEQRTRYCNLRIRGKPVRGDMRTVALTEAPADPSERRRLQLAPDQRVYRIKRARDYQGRPFMVEHVSLPAALFPGLAERNVTPLALPELAQAYGILLGRGRECVSIAAASVLASEVLMIPLATTVLHLDRVVMTRDCLPAEWRRGECIATKAISYGVAMKADRTHLST